MGKYDRYEEREVSYTPRSQRREQRSPPRSVSRPARRRSQSRGRSYYERVEEEIVYRLKPRLENVRLDSEPEYEYTRGSYQPSPFEPQYREVYVMILTWEFHDLRGRMGEDGGLEEFSLEEETDMLRKTFLDYGYHVQECLIPMRGSLASVKSKLQKFLSHNSPDTLFIVYYHGHGGLDDANELVFSSHKYPADLDDAQEAAAELFEAVMSEDACSHRGNAKRRIELLKKHQFFRPIAEVRWEDIRPLILGVASDLLLILDCCSAGGATLGRFVNFQPPPEAAGYTKHLIAACAFESTTRDDMTPFMCSTLADWLAAGASTTPLTTKRLHKVLEDRLQNLSLGSQPIFKQLVPQDPDMYRPIPLPALSGGGGGGGGGGRIVESYY